MRRADVARVLREKQWLTWPRMHGLGVHATLRDRQRVSGLPWMEMVGG